MDSGSSRESGSCSPPQGLPRSYSQLSLSDVEERSSPSTLHPAQLRRMAHGQHAEQTKDRMQDDASLHEHDCKMLASHHGPISPGSTFKRRAKAIQAELQSLENSFKFSILTPSNPQQAISSRFLKPSEVMLLLCLNFSAVYQSKSGSSLDMGSTRIPWVVYVKIPSSFPADPLTVLWAFHKGESHQSIDTINASLMQKTRGMLCIYQILSLIREVFHHEPVPGITSSRYHLPILVRDYAYDSRVDIRHWNKDPPHELTAFDLLNGDQVLSVTDTCLRSIYPSAANPISPTSYMGPRKAIALYDYPDPSDQELVQEFASSGLPPHSDTFSIASGEELHILDRPKEGWLLVQKTTDQSIIGNIPDRFVVHL